MGGRHSTEHAFALPTQPSRVRFLAFPNFFIWSLSRNSFNWKQKFDVAEIYRQQHCLDSGLCKKLNSWSNPSSTSEWQASTTKKLCSVVEGVLTKIGSVKVQTCMFSKINGFVAKVFERKSSFSFGSSFLSCHRFFLTFNEREKLQQRKGEKNLINVSEAFLPTNLPPFVFLIQWWLQCFVTADSTCILWQVSLARYP